MMTYELDDIDKEVLLGKVVERARADLNDGHPLTEMRRGNQMATEKKTDEPDPNRFFKWTVEIEVNEIWVADGFEVTAERVQEMIQSAIGYAYERETRVRVINAPPPEAIRKAQGYETKSANQ